MSNDARNHHHTVCVSLQNGNDEVKERYFPSVEEPEIETVEHIRDIYYGLAITLGATILSVHDSFHLVGLGKKIYVPPSTNVIMDARFDPLSIPFVARHIHFQLPVPVYLCKNAITRILYKLLFK